VLHDLRTSPRVLVIIRGTLLAPVNDLSMHLRHILPSLRQSIPNRPSAAAIITHMYRRLHLALVHFSRIFSIRFSAGFDPDPMDLTLRDECTPRGSIPAKRHAMCRTMRVLFGIRPCCLWKRCCYETPSRYHTARCVITRCRGGMDFLLCLLPYCPSSSSSIFLHLSPLVHIRTHLMHLQCYC